MSRSRRGPTPPRPWEPLTRRALDSDAWLALAAIAPVVGGAAPDEIWSSGLYTCLVRYARTGEEVKGRDDLLWLSIHRNDRKAVRDWRHFQAIKNEVAGPERLAIELYPPESDLVDTSNEYHLFVLPAGTELPFGFVKGGLVMTPEEVEASGTRAKQRAWEPGLTTGPPLLRAKPREAVTGERDRGYKDGYHGRDPSPSMTSTRDRDEYEDGYTLGQEHAKRDARGAGAARWPA